MIMIPLHDVGMIGIPDQVILKKGPDGMEPATLGGVAGAGEARSRVRDQPRGEHRGTFAFKAEHEAAMVQLLNSGDLVEFEGLVDGQRRRLKTRLTALSHDTGVTYFEGSGEAY